MSMTRLKFLSILSSGFAFAAARPARLLASTPDREKVILPTGGRGGSLSQDLFEQLKNSEFSVSTPRGEVRLLLEEVTPGPRDRRTNQFSLIFAAPENDGLAQGTYPVNHSTLKNLSLFLTPAGSSPSGKSLFRADFNLLRD